MKWTYTTWWGSRLNVAWIALGILVIGIIIFVVLEHYTGPW